MANYYIERRPTSKNVIKYRCQVRAQKKGIKEFDQSRTFAKKADAIAWGKKTVALIESQQLSTSKQSPTICELIITYLDDKYISESIGRSKKYGLKMIVDTELAKIRANELKTHHLVSFCKDRIEAGAKPQTVAVDISYLRSVYRAAKAFFNVEVSESIFTDSYDTLYRYKLIAKPERRIRRPEDAELKDLRKGLLCRQEHQAAKIPYVDLLDFSILSCMRIGEVCSIEWKDVDKNQQTVIVRNRKDPRKKTGNHMIVPLLGEAWHILQRQPKTDERIFPYNSRSVSAGFQRVRNELGIEDLRYHDFRREGASRLLESGYSIDKVALVTGHRDLKTLWQVYAELNPRAFHDMFNSMQRQEAFQQRTQREEALQRRMHNAHKMLNLTMKKVS